ncbi:MAG: sigma-70 family RNA polymerase sigma factor [Phycisphaerales bacterium]|nr:MAG: sigma-70 family RNA polymerase sigma factor [Phycisphaerales bacterium]
MENSADYLGLVRRAQRGDKESLERLTELADERLRVDVYRLTLRDDLTGEIVQESLLEMFKVLGDLKEANKFWPWLYKIALNKLRLHHRKEKRRREVTTCAAEEGDSRHAGQEALAGAITEELRQIVLGSMRKLTPRHRAVLTMRCYREMDYSAIGESMGCSEFAAKMLFYRAKKSLRRELSRYGFSKGMLVTALLLFGKITAPSEAAAMGLSVTAATTKVGVAAGLAAFLTSKSGVVSLTAAGALAVGTSMVASSALDNGGPAEPAGPAVVSPLGANAALSDGSVQEHWYYYPRKAADQVMMRLVRWDSQEKDAYCSWLQNDQANYYFDRRANTVHIRNRRMFNSDLSVWRLPTDDSQLREFIGLIEGSGAGGERIARDGDGLLVIVSRNEQGDHSQKIRHYNASDEQYFLYGWPAGARVVDERDAMHSRGWTYFAVTGNMDGRPVRGRGRVPFVGEAFGRHYPWLRLKVGFDLEIVDDGAAACVLDGGAAVIGRYRGGSFFSGLARPWTGLHSIDTVRRDAASQQTWFETKSGAEESKVHVALTCGRVRLTYTIDLENDLIEGIGFSTDDGRTGELSFEYLRQIDDLGPEFAAPRTSRSPGALRPDDGNLWLAKLMNPRW